MFLLQKKDSLDLQILHKLSELEKEIFQEKAWTFKMIKEEVHSPYSSISILIRDKDPVAYLLARVYLDEGEILRLAVKKDFQGKGFGRYLLENFLFEAYNKKLREIYLEVSEKNKKAINFYNKFGFRAVGVRKNYYDLGEDGVIMVYTLKVKGKFLEKEVVYD
ncbi:MAG: ribosomal protein S18-alanine N-acetyltransferase [Caldimicrobium sp.]